MTEASPRRGTIGYLVAAVALIGVVVGLVLVFGVVRPPALEPLAGSGSTPPGGVAWTEWNDRDGCEALVVARADGSTRVVACDDGLGELVGWTDRGIAFLGWAKEARVLTYRDPNTGLIAASDPYPGTDYYGPFGDVDVDSNGGLTVRDRVSGEVIWQVDAAGRYTVDQGWRSPDGAWYVLVDSFDRLLVVPAGGTRTPVIWANVDHDSYVQRVVWEGTDPRD